MFFRICSKFIPLLQKVFSAFLIFSLVYGPLPTRNAQASVSLHEATTSEKASEGALANFSPLEVSVGSTGNLNLSLPLNTFFPKGRISNGPNLALTYDSNSRRSEGSMGFGFGLNTLTISRGSCSDADPNPDYDDNDCFIVSGLGKIVPISDTHQATIDYRLQGGPYTYHFSLDRTKNCWTYVDTINAQKLIFCQTEQGPDDCTLAMPTGQYIACDTDPWQLPCDILNRFKPWEHLALDPSVDSNSSLETGTYDTDVIITQPGDIEGYDRTIPETASQIGVDSLRETLVETIIRNGDVGGSGPHVPEDSLPQGMTYSSSLAYSSVADATAASPYAIANQTERWWLSSTKDPFGNMVQHYYASCPNEEDVRLFHWNGVCWDGWDDSDSDDLPDQPCQFAARAIYSEREHYAPIHKNIYSPEILTAIEVRPVVHFSNGYPVLDEDTLIAKIEFLYEQNTSESQIRFGGPTLKEVRFHDGEGNNPIPPITFEYNNPALPRGNIKAFCEEPDYYPFYKPNSAEWITSTVNGISWTQKNWLSASSPGSDSFPYMRGDALPHQLQHTYDGYTDKGVAEIGALVQDGNDDYRVADPPKDNRLKRPDMLNTHDYILGCKKADYREDQSDHLYYDQEVWMNELYEEGDTYSLDQLENNCPKNPTTAPHIGDHFTVAEEGQTSRMFIFEFIVEDYFEYKGRFFPVASATNWNDTSQVYYGLPPEQCPGEYQSSSYYGDDQFGGCFVLGPYLWGGGLPLEWTTERTDKKLRWTDLNNDGFSDILYKDSECYVQFRSNELGKVASHSNYDPLSYLSTSSSFESCEASELSERYTSSWLSQQDWGTCSDITNLGYCYRFSHLPTDTRLGERGTKEDGEYPHWQTSDLMDCDGDGDLDWVTVGNGEILCWWNNSDYIQQIDQIESRALYDPEDVSFCKVPKDSNGNYPRGWEEDQKNLKCPVPLHRFQENGVLNKNDKRKSLADFIDFTADRTGSDWVYVDTNKPYWNLLRFDGGLKEEDLERNPFSRYGFGAFDKEPGRLYVPPRSGRTYRPLSEWEDDGKGEGIVNFGGDSWAATDSISSYPYHMYCDTTEGDKSGDSYLWTCYPFKQAELVQDDDSIDYLSFFSPLQAWTVKAPTPGPSVSKDGSVMVSMIDMNADGIQDIVDLQDLTDEDTGPGWPIYHGCIDDGEGSTDVKSCQRCPENRGGSAATLSQMKSPTFGGGLITQITYGTGRGKKIEWNSGDLYRYPYSTQGHENPYLYNTPMVSAVEETGAADPDLKEYITDDGILRREYNYLGCFSDENTGQFAGCPAVEERVLGATSEVYATKTYYLMEFPQSWGIKVKDIYNLNPSSSDIATSVWPSDTIRKERVLRGVPWARSQTSMVSALEYRTDYSVSQFPSTLSIIHNDEWSPAVFAMPNAQLKVQIVMTTKNDVPTREARSFKKMTYEDPSTVSTQAFVGYIQYVDDYGLTVVDDVLYSGGQMRFREITKYDSYFSNDVPRVAPTQRCKVPLSGFSCNASTGTCTPASMPTSKTTCDSDSYDYDFHQTFSRNSQGTLTADSTTIDDRDGHRPVFVREYRQYDNYGHVLWMRNSQWSDTGPGSIELRSLDKEYTYSSGEGTGEFPDIDAGRFLIQEITRGTDLNPLVGYFGWDRNVGKMKIATRTFLEETDEDPGSFGKCTGDCLEGSVAKSYDSLGRPQQQLQSLPDGQWISQCYYYSDHPTQTAEPWQWVAIVNRNSDQCWTSLPSASTLKKYPYQKSYFNSLGTLQTERSSNGSDILLQKNHYDRDGVLVEESQWSPQSAWNPKYTRYEHDAIGRILKTTLTTGATVETTGGVIDATWSDPNWVSGAYEGHQRTFMVGATGELTQAYFDIEGSSSKDFEVSYKNYDIAGGPQQIVWEDLGSSTTNTIQYVRDGIGRIVEARRLETGVHRVIYDADGAILLDQALSSANAVIRTLVARQDGLGRPVETIALDPSQWNTPFTLGSSRDLPDFDSYRSTAQIRVTYEYDASNDFSSEEGCANAGQIAKITREERKDSSAFTETQSFCWDSAGRLKKHQTSRQQTDFEESHYEVSLAYDAYSRITQREDSYWSGAASTPESERSSLITVLRWQDYLPQLSDGSQGNAIEASGGRVLAKSVHYDVKGRLQGVVLGNGTAFGYAYDSDDQLQATYTCKEADFSQGQCSTSAELLSGQVIEQRDPAGNILKIQDKATAVRNFDVFRGYEYDGLHQLTSEEVIKEGSIPLYHYTFSYDGFGNRKTVYFDFMDERGQRNQHSYGYNYLTSNHQLWGIIPNPTTLPLECLEWNEDGTLKADWKTPDVISTCTGGTRTQETQFTWQADGRLYQAYGKKESGETFSESYFYGADGKQARKVESASRLTDSFGDALTVVDGNPIRYFGIPGTNTAIASLSDPTLSFDPDPIGGPIPCGLFTSRNPQAQTPWEFLWVFLFLLTLLAILRWKITCHPRTFETITLILTVIFASETLTLSHVRAAGIRAPKQSSQDSASMSTSSCSPNIDSDLRFFSNDLRGNLVLITDDKGCTLETKAYSAFGEDACALSSELCYQAPGLNPLVSSEDPNFDGNPKNSATGLIVADARLYDPSKGMFISPDPLADEIQVAATGGDPQKQLYRSPIRMNLYAYAGNNPINRSDPTGEFWFAAWVWLFIIIPAAAGLGAFIYAETWGDGDGSREFLSAVTAALTFAVLVTTGNWALGKLGLEGLGSLWSIASSKVAQGVSGTVNGNPNPWGRIFNYNERPWDIFFDVVSFAGSSSMWDNGHFSPAGFGEDLVSTTLGTGFVVNDYYSQYQRSYFKFGFKPGRIIFQSYYGLANSLIRGYIGSFAQDNFLKHCGDGNACAEATTYQLAPNKVYVQIHRGRVVDQTLARQFADTLLGVSSRYHYEGVTESNPVLPSNTNPQKNY